MHNANPSLAYPTQTIFHWLAFGLALGSQGFVLGPEGFALRPQGFFCTNMLVSAMPIAPIGAVPNTKPHGYMLGLRWGVGPGI